MFQLLQAYVRVSRVRTRSGIVLSANELVNVAMTCRVSECSDRPVVVLPKCLLCQSVVVFRTVATSKSSATRECNTHWTRRSIPSWARGPTDSERYVRNHPPHQPTNQPTQPNQRPTHRSTTHNDRIRQTVIAIELTTAPCVRPPGIPIRAHALRGNRPTRECAHQRGAGGQVDRIGFPTGVATPPVEPCRDSGSRPHTVFSE